MTKSIVRREKKWDDIRILATLGVVLAHVAAPYTHGGEVTLTFVFANFMDTISRPSVGAFFLLSGMFALERVLTFNREKHKISYVGSYYARTFVRTILPSIVAVIVYSVTAGKQVASWPDFTELFSFDSILSTGYHLWFMYPLTYYLLLAPVTWILLGQPWGRTLINVILCVWVTLAVGVTSVYYYFGAESAKYWVDYFNRFVVLKHVGYFLMGFYLRKATTLLQENPHIRKWVWRAFFGSALITLVLPYMLLYAGINDPFHSLRDFERAHLLILSLGTVLLLASSEYFNLPSTENLPSLTYPVYLSHVFFIQLIPPFFADIPVVNILIRSCVVIALSYGFARLYNAVGSFISSLVGGEGRQSAENSTSVRRFSSPYSGATRTDCLDGSQDRREELAYIHRHGLRNDCPIPSKMIMSLTHSCNYTCVMCGLRNSPERPERDVSFWIELIAATNHSGMEYVFFGGEPLLYKDIDKLWDHCTANNVKFSIVSNGSFISDFRERFLRSKARLVLSVDGLGEAHNVIRGNHQAFDRVCAFIDFVRQASPSALNRITINTVIQPLNLDSSQHLPELVCFFRDRGLKVRLQHLQMVSRANQVKTAELWRSIFGEAPKMPMIEIPAHLQLHAVHLARLKEALFSLERSGRMPEVLPRLSIRDLAHYYDLEDDTPLDAAGFCMVPWKVCFIAPDGSISLCPLIGYETDRLDRGGDFWKAWLSERSRVFRTALIEHESLPICRHCCNYYSQ
jgi:MoaA/NifB/PqqE/SkfB family radical SAM enzyme